MENENGRTYPPAAQGLKRLTWAQVELIDAKISSLCAFTEDGQVEAHLVIRIRRGRVDFVEMTTSERLAPGRQRRRKAA